MTYEPEPLQWQMVFRGVGVILILIGIVMLIMDANSVKELESQILQKNTASSNKQNTAKNVTVNSGTVKSNPTPATPSKGTVDPIIVLDQFGHSVSQAKIWFIDNEARKYPAGGDWLTAGYWLTNENGRLQLGYESEGAKNDVPDGNDIIHIEKKNYTSIEFPVELTTDTAKKYNHITPNTFTIQKQGTIAAIIVDEAGKPMIYARYKLIGADGKIMSNGYPVDTGRIESDPVPDGQYTLHINDGYDDSTTHAPIDRVVTMQGGVNMFLGNITLIKK